MTIYTIATMTTYESMSISEFKATCLKVLERIRRTGQQLLITKNGEPTALVTPPPPMHVSRKTYRGIAKDTLKIHGDIVSPIKQEWDALK
jgi:prevent-host-death family protein